LVSGIGDGPFDPEPIENGEDVFYRRVPDEYVSESHGNKLQPGAFGRRREVEEGVSFDWKKYSTPQETLGRTTNPEVRAGVVKTTAGLVWDKDLRLWHAPEAADPATGKKANRAHSLVSGPNYSRVRKTLAKICEWEIELPREP